jgi:hypothetical protein
MLLGHDVNATALVYNRYCGCRYPRISTHFWRTEKTFILNFKPPSVSPHHWSTSLLHKLYRHPCSPYFTYYSFPPTKIGVVSILVELFVLPLGTQSEPIGHDWMTSDTPGGRGTSLSLASRLASLGVAAPRFGSRPMSAQYLGRRTTRNARANDSPRRWFNR